MPPFLQKEITINQSTNQPINQSPTTITHMSTQAKRTAMPGIYSFNNNLTTLLLYATIYIYGICDR